MKTDFDALIVGAGPAGASAAILLARAGWSVALIEKQRFPRRKVCGECIAVSNIPFLEALGVGLEFDAGAGPLQRQVGVMQGEHTIVASLPAAHQPHQAWGRALGRETLDTLLLDRARAVGVVVLQPWTVQSLDGVAGDLRCAVRAAGSEDVIELRAPVGIAAHGSWEHLPATRAVRRGHRQAHHLFAFKANFRNADCPEGLLSVLSFDGGYGGMARAEGGITTLACCIRADRLDALRRDSPGLPAGEVVEAALKRQCHGVSRSLRGASRDGAWLACGPLDPGIRLSATDVFFRIGNAAGEAHPIIGEGISMAIQSAFLLCARLLQPSLHRQGWTAWQREIGTHYAADWRRHFAQRLRLAAVFAHIAMRPAVGTPLLALLSRWPQLLTQGARWSGKVRSALNPASIAWLAAGAPADDGGTGRVVGKGLHA